MMQVTLIQLITAIATHKQNVGAIRKIYIQSYSSHLGPFITIFTAILLMTHFFLHLRTKPVMVVVMLFEGGQGVRLPASLSPLAVFLKAEE